MAQVKAENFMFFFFCKIMKLRLIALPVAKINNTINYALSYYSKNYITLAQVMSIFNPCLPKAFSETRPPKVVLDFL